MAEENSTAPTEEEQLDNLPDDDNNDEVSTLVGYTREDVPGGMLLDPYTLPVGQEECNLHC